MSNDMFGPALIGPGTPCSCCGEGYGQHQADCPIAAKVMPPMIASHNNLAWAIKQVQDECHDTAKGHGFWDETKLELSDGNVVDLNPWNFGEKIALIHSELSEALDSHRKFTKEGYSHDQVMDEHCSKHTAIEIELADTIIRILDLGGKMGYDLGRAVMAKMAFNKSRPYRHNKGY